MVQATFGFRGGELWDWFEECPSWSHMTCLLTLQLTIIPFPPGRVSEKCSPYGVACMQWAYWLEDGEPSWGWIHLDADAKFQLGQEMEEMKVDAGKWMYLVVRYDDRKD